MVTELGLITICVGKKIKTQNNLINISGEAQQDGDGKRVSYVEREGLCQRI